MLIEEIAAAAAEYQGINDLACMAPENAVERVVDRIEHIYETADPATKAEAIALFDLIEQADASETSTLAYWPLVQRIIKQLTV